MATVASARSGRGPATMGAQPQGLFPWLKAGPCGGHSCETWAAHTPHSWEVRVFNPEGPRPVRPPPGGSSLGRWPQEPPTGK